MPPQAPRARSPRQLLLYLVLVIFLGAAAYGLASRRDQLAAALQHLTWESVVGAFLFGLVAIFALLASWMAAVRDTGVDLPRRDFAQIFFVGQVGKYIPGSVWPVLTQAHLARRRGASPLRVGSGSLLSLAISVCVALALGGVLLPFSGHAAATQLWWVPFIALPLVIVLHPVPLNRLLVTASRVLKRGEVQFSYTRQGIGRSAAWALVGNLALGAHIFCLAHAVGASGPRGFLLSTCAFALASGVGVVVILAPAGAGVREAVLTTVLAPVLTLDAALVVALVSRAIFIVIDVGLGLSQIRGPRHRTVSAEEPAE